MTKFILTRELGRLAKWLRIMGFDTQYFTQDKISSLIIIALRDNRMILTRNRNMPDMHAHRILYINSESLQEQIGQVLHDLNIKPDANKMFSRCTVCNVVLEVINKKEVNNRVPEYVYSTQAIFFTCPSCKRVYWQGTHWGNAKKILDAVNHLSG